MKLQWFGLVCRMQHTKIVSTGDGRAPVLKDTKTRKEERMVVDEMSSIRPEPSALGMKELNDAVEEDGRALMAGKEGGDQKGYEESIAHHEEQVSGVDVNLRCTWSHHALMP